MIDSGALFYDSLLFNIKKKRYFNDFEILNFRVFLIIVIAQTKAVSHQNIPKFINFLINTY